jgi:biotin transporter BioY
MDTQALGGLILGRKAQADAQFKLYHYNPTTGGAVLFVLLFIGTTCFHAYQLFRTRCWFVVPFIIGGICKTHSVCVIILECAPRSDFC